MDESELRIDVYRHAQVGGETHVRVIHLPTGLTAEATGEGVWRTRETALIALEAALTANAKNIAI